jgi:hypothetical protein
MPALHINVAKAKNCSLDAQVIVLLISAIERVMWHNA